MYTRDLYLSLGNEALIEAERNRRLLIFRASYDSLVSLVSFSVLKFVKTVVNIDMITGL